MDSLTTWRKVNQLPITLQEKASMTVIAMRKINWMKMSLREMGCTYGGGEIAAGGGDGGFARCVEDADVVHEGLVLYYVP